MPPKKKIIPEEEIKTGAPDKLGTRFWIVIQWPDHSSIELPTFANGKPKVLPPGKTNKDYNKTLPIIKYFSQTEAYDEAVKLTKKTRIPHVVMQSMQFLEPVVSIKQLVPVDKTPDQLEEVGLGPIFESS